MLSKLVLVWIGFMAIHLASLLLPHQQYSELGSVNFGLQFLLFLLCVLMAWRDVKAYKPALINLAVLFGFSILLYLSIFIGTVLFKGDQYASLYYHQYMNKFGYTAILAITVLYLLIDYRYQRWKTVAKYGVTISLASALIAPFYYPYFRDPLHLYRTMEYDRYLDLREAHEALRKESGREPSEAELIQRTLESIQKRTGRLTSRAFAEEQSQLHELMAYTVGSNALTLFWKPLNLSTTYVNLALMALIIIFYRLKFRDDNPHGAYFEKIIFLFLLFCALEVLHSWSYTRSPNASIYYSIHDIGQYLIIAVLLAFVYVCSARLRFLLSPVGKYYEQRVIAQPETVSRWRDEIDRAILNFFLRRKAFFGRFGIVEKDKNQPL